MCSPTWWVCKWSCVPLTSCLVPETPGSPLLLVLAPSPNLSLTGEISVPSSSLSVLETEPASSSEVYPWATAIAPHKGMTDSHSPGNSQIPGRYPLLHYTPNHAKNLQVWREMSFSTVWSGNFLWHSFRHSPGYHSTRKTSLVISEYALKVFIKLWIQKSWFPGRTNLVYWFVKVP